MDRWTPVLEPQLVLAGGRLAKLLDGTWPKVGRSSDAPRAVGQQPRIELTHTLRRF